MAMDVWKLWKGHTEKEASVKAEPYKKSKLWSKSGDEAAEGK